MAPSAGNKKVANSLVTLSSAAILVVYAAGFMKTRAAAERLEEASNARRPAMPAPSTAGETRPPDPIEPPASHVANVAAAAAAAESKPASATEVAKPLSPAVRTTPAAPLQQTAEAPQPAADKAALLVSDAPAPPIATAPVEAAPVTAPIAKETVTDATPKAEDKEKAAPKLWPKEHYNDGTFTGWGTSRHGDIQASVTIADGRIVATSIAQCRTRYSCSWVAHLPGQVMSRQSQNVDTVSGATESANAFYWAVVEALNKAK